MPEPYVPHAAGPEMIIVVVVAADEVFRVPAAWNLIPGTVFTVVLAIDVESHKPAGVHGDDEVAPDFLPKLCGTCLRIHRKMHTGRHECRSECKFLWRARGDYFVMRTFERPRV